MRKRWFKLLFLLLFTPIVVNADNVDTLSINGTNSAKIGEEFTLTFKLKFKDQSESKGLYAVAFELDYVDYDFTITKISTDSAFNSAVVKTTDGKYYVVSELNGTINTNTCSDGVLFCGTYEAKLTFYTQDTKSTKSSVDIGEYEAILLNLIKDKSKEITEDDMTLVSGNGLEKTKHVIEISKKDSGTTVEKKKSIVENSKNTSKNVKNNIKTTKTTKKTTDNSKTNTKTTKEDNKLNNNLKTLKIKGYKIKFDKHKKYYDIDVEEGINKLKVTAKAEATNAQVKIKGADNLEKSKDKITITVTSEKGEKKSYVININRIKTAKKKKKDSFEITDDQMNTLKIFLIGVGVVALVVFIAIKVRDKIVEKGIDKL